MARSHSTTELLPLSLCKDEVPRLRWGFRQRARMPAIRLILLSLDNRIINYDSDVASRTVSVSSVPLRVFLRGHDLAIAHVNDAVAVGRRLRIVRDHQNRLA